METFTIVGVDYFGPIMVKTDEIAKKTYGLLFTCVVTRAVHLELVGSLTTRDFIEAYERFVSRRGMPSTIYSDNDKQFKKASKELKPSNGFNPEEVNQYFLKRRVEWKSIIDKAPWWGGFWERLIRVIKSLLKKHLGKTFIRHRELETVLIRIEGIVNARPMTYVSSDYDDVDPLTPSRLLMGKKSTVMALENEDQNQWMEGNKLIVKRERYRQMLVRNIWNRWKKEYVLELTKGNKRRIEKEIKLGYICLIEEDNEPRQSWKLGRIIKIHDSIDGKSRSVELRTKNGILKRPIQRVIPLELQCEPEISDVVLIVSEAQSSVTPSNSQSDVSVTSGIPSNIPTVSQTTAVGGGGVGMLEFRSA